MELFAPLHESRTEPYYVQLYRHIIRDIEEGRLSKDDKLPSIRQFSKDLGLSRTTIDNAYQQLLAEGYIYSRKSSGYYVSEVDIHFNKNVAATEQSLKREEEKAFPYDFRKDYADEGSFDIVKWKSYISSVLLKRPMELRHDAASQGEEVLRNELSKLVYRTRGVMASPDKIVIAGGIQALLNILTDIFRAFGISRIGMEDPGFNRAKSVFYNRGLEVCPLDVMSEGIRSFDLESENLRLCYVSPSHQFPLGSVMRVDQRMALIGWASRIDGFIIEDDFNSELRYEGKPFPALKALDNGDRVIYIGSFSGSLMPSIRISYMILPGSILHYYQEIKGQYAQSASKLEQLALMEMLQDGGYERHVRKLRKHYAKKREMMQRLANQFFDASTVVSQDNAGLNLLINLGEKRNEKELLKELNAAGVDAALLSEYGINPLKTTSILLNYRGIPAHKMVEGLSIAANILYPGLFC